MRVGSIASRWLPIFAALWTRRFVLKQAIVWVCRPANAGFALKHIIARLYRPSGVAFRRPAKLGTPARRAARWGRLWGCAPCAAPLASPPKHPQRRFSASVRWRGHASCAAGASLTRYAHSGDLPPRRVNAIHRIRFEQSPFQPTLIAHYDLKTSQNGKPLSLWVLCLSPLAIKSWSWRCLP